MQCSMSPFPETDSELDVPPVVVPVAGAVAAVAPLAGQEPDKENVRKCPDHNKMPTYCSPAGCCTI